MTIRRRARHILLLVALATGSSAVYAVPIEVGLGAFGPGAITIDFDAYPEGPVPVVPGITITGRPGEIGIQDGSRWGAPSDPGRNTLSFNGSATVNMQLDFDIPVTRVGFWFGGNTTNSVPVDLGLGGPTTGSFTVTSSPGPPDHVNNWIFYGYEDLAGIDRVTFGQESNDGYAVGIYDLVYETVQVPEPGTLGLMSIGLAGMAWSRRRKRVAA